MFFVLSKTIGLLTKPLIWLVGLALAAVFLRKPRLKRLSAALLLVFVLAFTNPLLVDIALRAWEPAPVAVETLPFYDVGIVLGGFARHLPVTNSLNSATRATGFGRPFCCTGREKSGKYL